MRKYIVILLCVLVSCSKHETKTQYSDDVHLGDSAIVNSSIVKDIDAYTGKWFYNVWINDSADENKSFLLELRKTKKDSIEGLFASVWSNGMRLDGGNANDEIKSNVWGHFVNDSLYVNIQGSYDEGSSAKVVLYLVNDSSLLWKVVDEDGEIYIPENVMLKKRCD